ncbi:zinc finger protein hangover-like [Triticum dicoccoides]|uniref:zinc finger protein hangover-like n=1 Tax=Triticum dicoccoides TaxID=85692 RepID=UPI00188F6A8E|nr:zinc finger protein hangover-like [Triticum dicoccoides]
MQRAAVRFASMAGRRFAASATRPGLPTGAAPLWPAAAVVNGTTRLSIQPAFAAAAAALCARRGYAGRSLKTKTVSKEEEEDDDDDDGGGGDFFDMSCDEDSDDDSDSDDLEDADLYASGSDE